MKRVCLILAGLLLVSMVGLGCEQTSHGRYRQMTHRRVVDADILGFNEDVDAAILLSERPSHLSQWYHQ